jgi:hypothetical protein
MIKYFFLSVLCFCNCIWASPLQDRHIDPAALTELATALGIPADADLIQETQKRWLRKPGQERWEMRELSLEERQTVLRWAEEQGLYSEWRPASQTYDQALILGATTSRMEMRLDYLVQLWKEGLRFDKIVWLTGERPLDPRVDGMMDRCKNEAEAARLIWKEANLPLEMRTIPLLFIEVPMKGQARPTTQDTLVAWLATQPAACQALFVSDQPFCGYQFAVIHSTLPQEFLFDVIGAGAKSLSHPAAAAITLDSIARWIYQETLDISPQP